MNPRTDAAKLYVRIFALLLVLGVGTQGVLAEIGPTNSDASSVAVKQLANSIFVDPVAPVTRTDGHVITVNEETVTAASTGPIDVEFISQVGGVTQSVYVQGNYAFIGEGPSSSPSLDLGVVAHRVR